MERERDEGDDQLAEIKKIVSRMKQISDNLNKIYLVASAFDKETEERQVAIFLNVVVQESVQLFNSLKLKDEEEKKDIDEVQKALEEYRSPKGNILHSRFLFYSRKHDEMEPFDSYLMDIRKLCEDCESKDSDDMLRDKVVLDSRGRE
ncbi:unnamed protein product [Phaedon cochleariae]|uniref:Uncharacterized protein n=1 Tax=Phaedon cochleariae TaxID=80249 RepID=A0A9N9S9Y1_PHACE|nr:unnamed protein product [Phaedon cochleariae]